MWELICHQTYAGIGGLPIDLSDYDSHGDPNDVEFIEDGVNQGSGAWRFPRVESRIRIPMDERPSKAWRPLSGIKVEVTMRRDYPQTHAQTLLAGHNSFSFFIQNSFLWAIFHGKSTYPWGNVDGLSSYQHTFNSQPYSLPIGKWMTLGFMHDGLDTMELYVNGRTIARRTGLLSNVPPVGPLGVVIGNEPDKNEPLTGDIDEVKVWRLNPYIVDMEFFSRPVDKTVADCWRRFFISLARALNRYHCRQFIQDTLNDALDRNIRAIVSKGPETRERFIRTSREYRQLWLAGKLDSPEMAKLFADWCSWLRLVDISFEDDPAIQDLLRLECLKKLLVECKPLDCDPQAAALVRLIIRSCSMHQISEQGGQ